MRDAFEDYVQTLKNMGLTSIADDLEKLPKDEQREIVDTLRESFLHEDLPLKPL